MQVRDIVDILLNINGIESILPSLTPKKPQSQYISRTTALFLSREKRNAA